MKRIFRKIKTSKKMLNDNGYFGFDAFRVFLDMIYCKIFLHSTYEEYFFYGFQNLKNRYRKNYLLSYHQSKRYRLVARDFEKRRLNSGKLNQYECFSELIKREYIAANPEKLDEIENFIKKHGRVIFKPVCGSQGKGIFSISEENMKERKEQWLIAISSQPYICEEYVVQHSRMQQMCPTSVNTIRIITLYDEKEFKIVSAGLRTGSGKGVCDNMSAGGVGAAVDVQTGFVFTTGVDFKRNRYYNHPVSGTQILGFQIPYWDEVRKMAMQAAQMVEKNGVAGWDIAITENGPCLIEGNPRPGARLAQIAAGKPYGEEIIRYINKKGPRLYKKTKKQLKKYFKEQQCDKT